MSKKPQNQQYYVNMTFFFFLDMLTFWFYVMPLISKTGKRDIK